MQASSNSECAGPGQAQGRELVWQNRSLWTVFVVCFCFVYKVALVLLLY